MEKKTRGIEKCKSILLKTFGAIFKALEIM
jgi:hypothetical protein